MLYTIFAYKDTELGKFQPCFIAPASTQDAVEGITDAAIKGKVDDCAHKELYKLGIFDTQDASFELDQEPVLVLDLKPFGKVKGTNA